MDSGKNKKGKVYVGTSGWSYEDWAERFYPSGLRKKDWFSCFATHFKTVELNATFYRLFEKKTYQGWAQKALQGFIYALKMWRWITHRKRLKDVASDTQTALERAALLGNHLDPVLIQLPPGLYRDDRRLAEYIQVLKKARKKIGRRFKFAFEFRHESWIDDQVFSLLDRNKFALCLPDWPKLEFPRIITSHFSYIRFHGCEDTYQTLYPKQYLQTWAYWIQKQISKGIDVYAYFNNDYHVHAVTNAKQLLKQVKRIQ